MKLTIEEKAMDIVSARRFANRERKAMAQKIVDFMDIPAYQKRYIPLTPAQRELERYYDQCGRLGAHVNCRYVCWLIQTGQIP